VELTDLPPVPPVALAARVREGGAGEVTETVLEVLRSNLSHGAAPTPPEISAPTASKV
jgi:hypothetical protein